MSHLLKNIIQRHIHPQNTVLPRLQGNSGNLVGVQPDRGVEMPAAENPNNTFSGSETTLDVMAGEKKTAFSPGIQEQKSVSVMRPEPEHFGAYVSKKQQTDATAETFQEPAPPKSDARLREPSTQIFPTTAAARPQDIQERMQSAITLVTALKPANQEDGPLFEHLQTPFRPDIPTGFEKWQHAPPQTTKLPVVKIHIGRIEIKAVKENPQQQRKAPDRPKPAMSLDQYLKERTKP